MARRAIIGSVIPRVATRTHEPDTVRTSRYVGGTPADQWTRRTNPQIWQVASPVTGSTSRKLGQPLVPQKSRELAAAPLRRRIRRIADARPVTADVVERFIMVVFAVLSGAP
jgi:hypothetical protein